MFKIEIENHKRNKGYVGTFDTIKELDTWIEGCVSNNSWGREGDYTVGDPVDMTALEETRLAKQEDKKEFNYDRVVHILLKHGPGSVKFQEVRKRYATYLENHGRL